MNDPSKRYWLLTVVAVVLLLGIFVWPTRYRYDHISGGGRSVPIRIDRLSGKAEILRGSWRCYSDCPTAPLHDLDATELSKLDLKVTMDARGYLSGNLYNGTDWTITEITYQITITTKGSNTTLLTREFEREHLYAKPLHSDYFNDNTGIDWNSDTMGYWSIGIKSAKGERTSSD